MKIRPQKHVRQGFSGKSKLQRRSQPKTRKEIRKEKRQQKKINRFNYHSRKRSDRFGGREQDDPLEKQKQRAGKGGESDESEEEWDEDDEEIDSDLADDVPEEKEVVPEVVKGKGKKGGLSQLEREREEELRELKSYEQGLREKRIAQLEAANAEDDAIIKKYEKLLKINRRKNKDGVPKSFNDGLDYALELCSEENIRKMYEAAREAAELEQNSEDEFADDMGEVLGRKKQEREGTEGKGKKKLSDKERKRMEKLKEVERKYLGDDEMDDGSLGGFDSELEIELASDYSENDELYDSEEDEPVGKKNGKQKKVAFKEEEKKKKKNTEPEEDSEFDEDVFGLDSEDSEEPTPKKKKKDAGKGKQKKKVQSEPEEDSEFDEDVFGLDSEDEIEEPISKKKKKDASNGNQKKKKGEPEPEPEEDSEFDEDVFGLDSEDEVEEEPARKSKKKDKKKVTFEKKASKNKKKKEQSESEPEEDSKFDEDVFGGDSEDDGLDNILDGIGSDAEETKPEEKSKEKAGVWEDIYGRKRDKDGNVIKEESGGKYIPPHMRARMEAQTGAGDAKRQEKLARLKRTLKGQINRLAETNVHRISIELDNLYMQNARFDMNNLLTTLILEAIVSNSLSPERMVLEHTLLVTILHANVGSEVGSHFLETVVERFHSLIGQIEAFDVEDKTLDNCILILCHLYTFQIFKNKLIYDVIDKLLEKFCEKAVECILLVLRSIGFVLRKDDPLALKDMILKVQKRAAEAPTELKNDTRVKYMLDTLLAVKNNNMNKIPQYDPTLVEHFRKILKGMITSGKYVSSLNIGLDDLLNVEERGKWWLVGSAWMGDTGGAGGKQRSAKNGTGGAEEEGFSQQLLELARKQRMNTDDKRNVFCAIMSAEDYLDAFDKILRLAIKDQRIVASVIVHCALAEKDYNPYYSVLSEKFCEYDRRYQLAIQYTIWDRLKDIQSLKQAPIRNLAKLLTHLIGEGGLALSVLKVIEFAEIDKPTLRLVRQTMLGLLLLEDENKCLQVFNRIAPSFKLKSFKDSLRLFLHHFLLKGSDRSGVPEEQMQLLHQRIKMAERMLDTSEARVQF